MSVAPTDNINAVNEAKTLTLGEVLYADPAVMAVSEKEWVALVRAMGAGDESALRRLYEQAFPVVFTYLMRLTGDRHATEALLVDVFQAVWCEAPVYESADGPVLAWIMRHARALALAHERKRTSAPGAPAAISDGAAGHLRAASPQFQQALEMLTRDERRAIEGTFLDGLSHAELAARGRQPIGTVKSLIRSGLVKLQRSLRATGDAT